jgi:SAM-dependent methyltransferase
MKLTKELVKDLYNSFLGRDPENDYVISNHCENHISVASFIKSILSSQEYLSIIASNTLSLKGDEAKMEIDYSTDINLHFNTIKQQWIDLGKTKPYWSVLSHDKFVNPSSGDIKTFYELGVVEFQFVINVLRRLDITLADYSTCLEYGCGLGRVTQAMSRHFSHTYGYDISNEHIELARNQLSKNETNNISFKVISELKELDSLPKVDFFYSQLVLQHNPPSLILYILEKLFKSLNKNGIGYFQVPTYLSNYSFHHEFHKNTNETFELHAIDQHKIFEIIETNGIKLIDIFEDNQIGLGSGNRSNTIIVKKIFNSF